MKNDYKESENGGLAWPYDHRPMADQGLEIYHQNKDGQGSLVSLPEKETRADKYDRLLKGLYNFARENYDTNVEDDFDRGWNDMLNAFIEDIGDTDPDAAHQVMEGVRDAAKSTAKRGEGEGVDCADALARLIRETQQRVAQITDEEVAFVRNDKPEHDTFAEMAQSYRTIAGFHGPHAKLAGHFVTRLASIAEYLAKEEGA